MNELQINNSLLHLSDTLADKTSIATQVKPIHKNIQIRVGDCFTLLPSLVDNSVHMVLTDPPYFIDKFDDTWNDKKINTTNSNTVGNLPAGMKFSPDQSINFGKFFSRFAKEIYRVLAPGGFFISFSQGRLYQRMAVASEDAGFWIRDMLAWHYTKKAQPKAFSLDHFINKKDISDHEKTRLKNKINGRKTPQLKPAFEPLMLAQKPLEKTFIDNYDKWGVGLIDTSITIDGYFPSNLIKVEKPDGLDKYDHPTQKPIVLLEHLIKIFSQEGQTVLDPFLGSGSTAIASLRNQRKFIGYEIELKYINIIKKRLEAEIKNSK